MKANEKKLVGFGMIAGGIALIVGLGIPQWDAFTANNTQLGELTEELKGLETEKETLSAQITLLEQNTDVPIGVNIRTYQTKNREEVIKQQLDQVVELATEVGNKFISLAPTEATPLVPEAPTDAKKEAAAADSPAAADASADPNAPPAPPPPILSTFGYELAIRGTYETVQQFLKQMANQKELVEISEITLENEMNSQQPASPDKIIDPGAPIRLTAKLRLTLQPRES